MPRLERLQQPQLDLVRIAAGPEAARQCHEACVVLLGQRILRVQRASGRVVPLASGLPPTDNRSC
jgi:hypothetical protein